MTSLRSALLLATLLTAVAAQAQTAPSGDHASHHAQPPAASTGAAQLLSEGEVRKLNREQGKVTLRHGPLSNLDMPPMTMVFTAIDPKLLDGLKEGDKVRFTAGKKDGGFIVTAIQAAR